MDNKINDLNALNFDIKSSQPISDLNFIRAGILNYNSECLNQPDSNFYPEPVTIVVKDGENRRIAGAFGYAYLNVFTVEGMFIEKEYRGNGLGRKLSIMLQAEAKKRNCHTATLETYSFAHTAKFYNKLGVLFAKTIPNSPKGHKKYFLINKLEEDKSLIWKFISFLQRFTY
jgi:GNAT superfamily N-acetyltransferase